MKKTSFVFASLVMLSFMMSFVLAQPTTTEGFVCPVFNSNSAAGTSNPNAVQIGGGDYTIVGPEVTVPLHATNNEGAGSPGGPHASPGEPGYTAIWSGN